MTEKTIEVERNKIACDGGASSSHPRVWLQIEPKTGEVTCPYCENRYVLKHEPSQ